MSDWGCKLIGDENTDTFPWATVNPEGEVIGRYSHRSMADQRADRERMNAQLPYEFKVTDCTSNTRAYGIQRYQPEGEGYEHEVGLMRHATLDDARNTAADFCLNLRGYMVVEDQGDTMMVWGGIEDNPVRFYKLTIEDRRAH